MIIKHIFLPILCALLTFLANIFGTIVTVPTEKEEVEIVNSIAGDTTLDNSILYANEMQNTAQAYYTDDDRSAYRMQNADIILTHELTDKGNNRRHKGVIYCVKVGLDRGCRR